jgi:hypothetical protein
MNLMLVPFNFNAETQRMHWHRPLSHLLISLALTVGCLHACHLCCTNRMFHRIYRSNMRSASASCLYRNPGAHPGLDDDCIAYSIGLRYNHIRAGVGGEQLPQQTQLTVRRRDRVNYVSSPTPYRHDSDDPLRARRHALREPACCRGDLAQGIHHRLRTFTLALRPRLSYEVT